MGQDVFVSYSTKDKTITDAIIASLEQNHIRCWYAPRDINPSDDWGKAITRAIDTSKIFLLVFSGNSNQSQRVLDELNLAISSEIPILPFRIEKLEPDGAMRLHLSSRHWLDAFDPSWESHIRQLINTVSAHLETTILEEDVKIPEAIKGKGIASSPKSIRRIIALIASVLIAVTAGWYGLTKLNVFGVGSRVLSNTPTEQSLTALNTDTNPLGTNTVLPDDSSRSVEATLPNPTASTLSNATQTITVGIEDPSCSDVIPELEVQMRLIFCEPFDDNSNGWQVGEFSSSDISDKFSLQNGIYSWQIDCANNNFGCVSPSYPNSVNRLTDFYLAADFRLLEGPTTLGYGLRFRNDGANYYEFLISDNQTFSINSWNGGNFEFLIFDQNASSINPGNVNSLAIHAAGNRFVFYINNLLVADIENDYISEGIPGVATYLLSSGQGNLEIDNFSIYIP